MLQVRGGQGSEQRRQRAPHLAEVLQKPSVKRFSTTSCNGLRPPREYATLKMSIAASLRMSTRKRTFRACQGRAVLMVTAGCS